MKKKIYITLTIVLILIIALSTNVNAMYQSRSGAANAKAQVYASAWAMNIRKMESGGYGMGLTESIDETTLKATTPSNNIDVHLQKNTEYGAAVLLGASQYGKQGDLSTNTNTTRYMHLGSYITTGTKSNRLATSTGNVYGVYELYALVYKSGNATIHVSEWTAGGGSEFLANVASRYVDRYTTSEDSAKPGDATVETKRWHGSRISNWIKTEISGFARACDINSSFSYAYYGAESVSLGARAAVVNGEGV